jgi:uncharacterized protein (TIGR00106 family)
MILVEFSVLPVGQGASIGAQVAKSLDIVDKSGIEYQLGPMGTVLEGTWDEVFAVVKRCYEEAAANHDRLVMHLKVDHRKGGEQRLAGRVEQVEARLGRKLRR